MRKLHFSESCFNRVQFAALEPMMREIHPARSEKPTIDRLRQGPPRANEERVATARVRSVARVPTFAVERQRRRMNGEMKWSRPMRLHLPCGVLALVIAASAAQAQTVITGPVGQPVGTVVTAPAVVQPAETIQTIQTIRTVRAAPQWPRRSRKRG